MGMLAIFVSQMTYQMVPEPTKQAGGVCIRSADRQSARGLTWCVLLTQGIHADDIGLHHQLGAIHLPHHCMVMLACLHTTKCT